MDEATAATLETTEATAIPEPAPSEPEPQIALDEDGSLSFQDAFWGMAGDAPKEEPEPKPAPEPAPVPAPAIEGYTDEELADTPWEQWDAERISGDVKRYIPIVQEQLRRRAAAAEAMRATQPAQAPQQAPMGDKEILAEAMSLTRQRLGLKDGEDLDFYEPEHVAAMALSVQDARERDRAQVAWAQESAKRRQDFGAWAASFAARGDFPAYNQWLTQQIAAAGMRPEQLREYLENTGDYAGVQKWVQDSYEAWRKQRTPTKAPQPPAVETAGGAAPSEKKVIDLRSFGDLDEDEQARALIAAGLV